MLTQLKRRKFINRLTYVLLGCLSLGVSCNSTKKKTKQDSNKPLTKTKGNNISENLLMPEDLVMDLLDQKVEKFMHVSFNCAQSSFMALKEQFGLEENGVVKALTPLTGIAERGETCGAVIGPLMVFGILYGRDENRLGDWEVYRNSLVPSGKFCRRFEEIYGSTMCHRIQDKQFGRCYRLTNPKELKEFQENGATDKCTEVVKEAVHIAANIILEKEKSR